MGQCYIVRRGGAGKSVPILKAEYPADLEVWGDGGSATFKVEIEKAGRPSACTYQWYRNGTLASWATGPACTFYNLSQVAAHSVYCVVTNAAGSVISRTATLKVKDPEAAYTFTGSSEKKTDDDGNWEIWLKTSGSLCFTGLGKDWDGALDAFLVGGGSSNYYGVGGSGGNTLTGHLYVRKDSLYLAQIGAGGTNQGNGGNSVLTGLKALGGKVTGGTGSGGGGTGSSQGGNGGSDGGAGTTPSGAADNDAKGRAGQGTTTRKFGEADGLRFSPGGGGACSATNHNGTGGADNGANGEQDAADNTGAGAGGTSFGAKHTGGSGVVILRKAVLPSVTISRQPQDASVAENANAIFTVTASGTGLTYQWQFLPTSENDASGWSDTSATGATTSQLTVQALSYRADYRYRCIVTDGSGYSIISAPATLQIAA